MYICKAMNTHAHNLNNIGRVLTSKVAHFQQRERKRTIADLDK